MNLQNKGSGNLVGLPILSWLYTKKINNTVLSPNKVYIPNTLGNLKLGLIDQATKVPQRASIQLEVSSRGGLSNQAWVVPYFPENASK